MSVSITWSSTSGGSTISNLAHGNASNGANTTAQQIYVRHDGAAEITDCVFYFGQKTGLYTGNATAADDFTELVSWGDGATANAFGGIQINMDAVNGFTGGATWGMSESQKTASDGLKYTARTSVGDSSGAGIPLRQEMSSSMTGDQIIPAGVVDASFQLRLKVPQDEATIGIRQFDQILSYVYTS
jgi:hypothetical protein